MRIEDRLNDLGIVLPAAPAPLANYVPWTMAGGLLFVSGQLPMEKGAVRYTGPVGEGVTLEDAVAAARLCAVNILAWTRAALNGDWDRLTGCVRLEGFVNAPPGFEAQPAVVNGASDLLADILGTRGRHARIAVGVASLPANATVEIAAILSVRD